MPARDTLAIETDPDPKDVQSLIDRLIEYNCAVTGYHDGQGLAIFIRAEDGQIQGGLSGFTWGGACKIEWLWVSEDLRGKGSGRALVSRAEEEARRRGCIKMVVETHSFQAPDFYQKMGFKIIGQYTDFPRGHCEYFLEKRLA